MIFLDISKTLFGGYGEMQLDIKLDIKSGEFVALAGESGSGKTTLLRILAGLEDAVGKIEVDGQIWMDGKKVKPVQKRDVGFVFQDYALFDNMTVEENLLFANNDKNLADYLLNMTGLYELKKRLPSTLSGGQKQRVALCRAFMRKPKLLLMDEPLSALDPAMRAKLQNEILQLHKEFKTTTIMVSHDPSEIYHLANRVIVLNKAKIISDGLPREVLLKKNGFQKFSFEAEVLDIVKADLLFIVILSIGQQLIEIVIDEDYSKKLKIGQKVNINPNPFSIYLSL